MTIRSKLHDASRWLRARRENWLFGLHYENLELERSGFPPRSTSWVAFLWDELRTTIRYRIYGTLACRWFGHTELICEDWGGPEGGGMAGYCDRCGFSYSHVLY